MIESLEGHPDLKHWQKMGNANACIVLVPVMRKWI